MVKLARQLIDRQAGTYDPADVEDRYEARLRTLIDAKLKGEGIDLAEETEPERGNVIDLMSALKRSLGQSEDKPAAKAKKSAAKAPARKTPAAKSTPKRRRARAIG